MCDSVASGRTSPEGSDESTLSLDSLVEEGKNKNLIQCRFCPSQILSPDSGSYEKGEFELPKIIKHKKVNTEEDASSEVHYEQLTHFWQVPNMYTFENIGFSNTVGNIKYLACADCEVGPIGYYDMNTKISYVALARVTHVN